MKKTEFLMVTCNRLLYTKQATESILANDFDFKLRVVDNGSDEEGMIDYLNSLNDSRIKLELMGENKGLAYVTNRFWENTDAEVVGKIDNDTTVPVDGVKRLYEYMERDRLCIIGGFHFNEAQFGPKEGDLWIDFDGLQVKTAQWIGGCFYLMKKAVVDMMGLLERKFENSVVLGWTGYQIEARKRGVVVGYASPVVKVFHLPDAMNIDEEIKHKDYYYKVWMSRRAKPMVKPGDKVIAPDDFTRFGRT